MHAYLDVHAYRGIVVQRAPPSYLPSNRIPDSKIEAYLGARVAAGECLQSTRSMRRRRVVGACLQQCDQLACASLLHHLIWKTTCRLGKLRQPDATISTLLCFSEHT